MKWHKNLAFLTCLAIVVVLVGCPMPNGGDGADGADGADAPPAPVDSLEAVPGDGEVSLSWSDPEDEDLAEISVTWAPDGETPSEVSAGIGTFTATGLTNGTEYTFTVVAVDAGGNASDAATARATPIEAGDPDDGNGDTDTTPPGEVTITGIVEESGKVTLTWNDPADQDLDAVEIIWDNGGFAEVDAGVQSLTATGLQNGFTYEFTISAVDTSGNASAGVSQEATPHASNNARLADLTLDGASLAGFDPETTEYSATRPNGTTEVEIGATAEDSNATVSGELGIQSVSTGANALTVTVTAEDGETARTYTIEVSVEASADAQLADLTVDGTTVAGFSASTYFYVVSRPAPTNVTVGATPADAQATVSGTGSESVGAGRTALDVVVTAPDGISTATYTVEVQIAPAAPTGLTASDGTEGDRIALVWNAASSADAYAIYRRVAGSSDAWSSIAQETASSYVDDSIEAASGALYEYEVTALLDGLEGDRSNRDSGFAGSDLSIGISFDNPDDPVILVDAATTVAQGTNLSVTADTGYATYAWYLDGTEGHAAITGSGSTVTVSTGGLAVGVHALSLVVSDGSNIYSAGLTFTVES